MMKSYSFFFYVLLLFGLSACGTAKFDGINKVDDDVYWSKHDEPKTGTNYKDIEKWNKSKGPNPGAAYEEYSPEALIMPQTEPQSTNSTEEERAQEAYKIWLAKRGMGGDGALVDTTKNANVLADEKDDSRDARRFGSERTYYYDDPYYNSLSSNWSWTSFYTPIIRPGFYNCAPGWNIGLSWNNRSGFNFGVGYNFGIGFNAWDLGYGYNPYPYYGFDAWGYPYYSNPYYNAWGYGYQPFYSPWGYNPWYYNYGYNYFYNPYSWGCGGVYHRNNSNQNDIVSNRPMMRPRTSLGSSVPGIGSRPGANGEMTRAAVPGSNRPELVKDGGQRAYSRPDAGGNSTYVPSSRAAAGSQSTYYTNRPGGDLTVDSKGRPVYVSPTNRPSNASVESVNEKGNYSSRPGGELKLGSDGRPVYVPARPRRVENTAINDDSRSPEPSYSGGSRTFEGSRPARSFNSNSSNTNSVTERPSNINTRPSAPQAAPSRPAPGNMSAPVNTRPSSSGGSFRSNVGGGNTNSSGGSVRPR